MPVLAGSISRDSVDLGSDFAKSLSLSGICNLLVSKFPFASMAFNHMHINALWRARELYLGGGGNIYPKKPTSFPTCSEKGKM